MHPNFKMLEYKKTQFFSEDGDLLQTKTNSCTLLDNIKYKYAFPYYCLKAGNFSFFMQAILVAAVLSIVLLTSATTVFRIFYSGEIEKSHERVAELAINACSQSTYDEKTFHKEVKNSDKPDL